RRNLTAAKQAHVEEQTRLEKELAEALEKSESDEVRTQAEGLRAECDRLDMELEETRSNLAAAKQAHLEEQSRLEKELAEAIEQHRRLQDRNASTEVAWKAHQERGRALLQGLDRFRSAFADSFAAETPMTAAGECPPEAAASMSDAMALADRLQFSRAVPSGS